MGGFDQWLGDASASALLALPLAAVLLYCAVEIVDAADRRRQGLRLASAVLAGTALWWPPQALSWGAVPPLGLLLSWVLNVGGAWLLKAGMRPPPGRGLPLRLFAILPALALLGAPLLLLWLMPRATAPAHGGLIAVQLALLAACAAAAALRQQLRQAARRSSDAQAAQQIDPLTQLPNRLGIEQQLGAAVSECDRTRGRLAVLVFDLDGLKPIISSFGHDSADALLGLAAKRLLAALGDDDLAGRIGGDDFVVLLRHAPSAEAIAKFATRTLAQLAKPYQINEREIVISCSVGIALYPDDGGQTRLLARADAAKNAAKRLGGACYSFYAPGMGDDSRDQLDMLRDLRRAIENKELALYYQPKIDAASGQVTAAEALLRWRHPVRGLVSPEFFIPIAERFGYMRELGNWVIDEACRQAREWREKGLRMRVAINLSAHQMRQADIVARIQTALSEYHIHPSLLTCEITESVAMEDTRATQETFRSLGRLGVHLSIDDFGTGYSSLSYLRQLPAAELKIDRAFITDVDSSKDAQAVVDAVLKLAHALGLRVVAEGVENPRQHAVLMAMGCDEFQGYLFARPMSARDLLQWAVNDKGKAQEFRASLFGSTRYEDPGF